MIISKSADGGDFPRIIEIALFYFILFLFIYLFFIAINKLYCTTNENVPLIPTTPCVTREDSNTEVNSDPISSPIWGSPCGPCTHPARCITRCDTWCPGAVLFTHPARGTIPLQYYWWYSPGKMLLFTHELCQFHVNYSLTIRPS